MIPKYEKIKLDLLDEIKTHKFLPGDRFYTEADVKQNYGVSSITAVKALNELTAAGYLYRVQGKGTFVSKSKVSQIVKFTDQELESHAYETVKVLSIEKGNDSEILKELGLTPADSYYRFVRIRFFKNIPFLVHISHLPQKLVKKPISRNKSFYSSIYERVRKDFNVDLFSMASMETNEVDFPENAKILSLLDLSFREPAVKQIKHTYFPDKSVAEYTVSYKHWKYFKIKIEVEGE
ncbi:GntR family transcriptional regulator [Lactovum odontotermitis]